jgi:putative transposase
MKGSRFSEEQIIGILREAEAGLKTAEVCRRHGIAEATLYKWKAKYGGMEVADAKRLKGLEDENRRLKKRHPHVGERAGFPGAVRVQWQHRDLLFRAASVDGQGATADSPGTDSGGLVGPANCWYEAHGR